MSYSEADKLKNGDLLPDEKKPDRLDKIKSHLMTGEELTDQRLKESLKNYKMALAFMLENEEDYGGRRNTPSKCIKYLEDIHGYSYSQAAKIVRETMQLYSDITFYDKASLKFLHYERLMRLADEAAGLQDYKAAATLEKQAIELMELNSGEKMDKKQVMQFFQINIQRTTDPTALQKTIELQQ